jgi:protein-disulfide isomerase
MTLSPDDRGQDEVREALEESIGQVEPRVAKAPLPADEHFMNMEARLSAPITSDDHIQGPIDATVTLVQYGDYECPYTRMSRHSVHQLQRQYPDTLRFVFRHFPLEAIHPHARAAAMAAEAAGAQTDFWTMHDYLFEHQQALAESDLHRYALELRLDADRFEHDRRSSQVIERVERDLASGEASGVQGTPTFFVNGTRHDGAYDLESLRSAIVGHLRSGSEHQDDSA